MVIATKTHAITPYYPKSCQDLLIRMNDTEEMVLLTKHYWQDDKERTMKAKILQEYVLQEFSPEAYTQRVADLVTHASKICVDNAL